MGQLLRGLRGGWKTRMFAPARACPRIRRPAPRRGRSRATSAGTGSSSGASGSRSRRAPRSGGRRRSSRVAEATRRRARARLASAGARSSSRAASSVLIAGEERGDGLVARARGLDRLGAGRPCGEVRGRERVARAGRVDGPDDFDAPATCSIASGVITHEPLRAESQDDLGDAERLERLRLGAPDERRRLLVVELEDRRRGGARRRSRRPCVAGRGPGVRTRPCASTSSLPAVRGECRERLGREVRADERADVDPAGVGDRLDRLRRASTDRRPRPGA